MRFQHQQPQQPLTIMCDLFTHDGEKEGTFTFVGDSPQVGDKVFGPQKRYVVDERIWRTDGRLTLIVSDRGPVVQHGSEDAEEYG